MPTVEFSSENQESISIEVKEGMSFTEIYDDCGVGPFFGCRSAACGSCEIEVIAGGENLSTIEQEEAQFLGSVHDIPMRRLACQARINGNVSVKVL